LNSPPSEKGKSVPPKLPPKSPNQKPLPKSPKQEKGDPLKSPSEKDPPKSSASLNHRESFPIKSNSKNNNQRPRKSTRTEVPKEIPLETNPEPPIISPKPKDEIDYYAILDIPRDATPAQIKKAYYQKARDYHPDKNENPQAEEIFKLISEAYNILSDDNKRQLYDKYGLEGVKASEQGVPDPSVIFKMIFGCGSFDDIFGELNFVLMFEINPDTMSEEEIINTLEKKNKERKEKLIEQLLKKLDPFITGEDKGFKSQMGDITEKLDSPGGPALLSSIGYVYLQEAKKNLSRYFGIQSWFAGLEEKGHELKQSFSLISSIVKLQVAHERLEQEGENQQIMNDIMSQGLSTIWKIGLLEIESTVRDVCQTVLNVPEKNIKKEKSGSLRRIRQIIQKRS
jgi:curved DNA-binding protein CbpA